MNFFSTRFRPAGATVFAACLIGFAGFAAAPDVQVPRWEPHDFTFTCPVAPANPFQVAFSAKVTGVQLTVPGFYDGNGTWKGRSSSPRSCSAGWPRTRSRRFTLSRAARGRTAL